MEGIIQYRLLGNHPAASGRYLTVGFPGETTTTDQILDQVVQEHRINTSRYKLEVCRLVPARDAPTSVPTPAPPPPEGSHDAFSLSGVTSGAHNALIPVTIYGPDELHTYDRLTITVSKRDIADDEASRKETERLEHQRRLKEMEEQLLLSTSRIGHFIGDGGVAHAAAIPPSQPSSFTASARQSSSSATATVDNLRFQRAAALAGQLFPILKDQCGPSTGLHDLSSTHKCVLCRFAAFEEMLTACCSFRVCRSCYVSASEMVMKEDQCPVCGTTASPVSSTGIIAGAAFSSGGVAKARVNSTPYGKRRRDVIAEDRTSWKTENGDETKLLRPGMSAHADRTSETLGRHGIGGSTVTVAAGPRNAAASASASRPLSECSSLTTAKAPAYCAASRGGADNVAVPRKLPEDVLRTEARLRNDLDQALSMLDAPDPLPVTAKAKRIISAELAALCE